MTSPGLLPLPTVVLQLIRQLASCREFPRVCFSFGGLKQVAAEFTFPCILIAGNVDIKLLSSLQRPFRTERFVHVLGKPACHGSAVGQRCDVKGSADGPDPCFKNGLNTGRWCKMGYNSGGLCDLIMLNYLSLHNCAVSPLKPGSQSPA